MPNSPLGHSEPFAIFMRKWNFWAVRNATKNGTNLGRPGIRFAAPKNISKGAQFRENFTKIRKKKWRNRSALEA
jgi:hypothetical protein